MLKIKDLVEALNIFERNKVPLEIKILGIAIYFQTSSIRRTAKILSEIHPVSRTAVWRWIKKLEQKLPVSTEKKVRETIAVDETVVKANKKKYYVYAAIDVERNELILMRVYTTRNLLTSKYFVKEVLKFCENKPKFVIDKAPWLRKALDGLELHYEFETFRQEKLG